MQSVTSNAVYNALNTVETWSGSGVSLYKIGKIVFLFMVANVSGSSPCDLVQLPWKPVADARCAFMKNSNDVPIGQFIIYTTGVLRLYLANGGTFSSNTRYTCSIVYITND